VAIIAIKKETIKKKCPICGDDKSIATGFYKSSSPLFSLEHCVPICISCVKKEVINRDGTVNENKLKTMCQRLDKPYYIDELDSAFLQCKKEHGYLSDDEVAKYGNEIIGFYFKNINTLRQNKNKSFSDSEKDGFVHKTVNTNAQNKKEQTLQRYSDIKEKNILTTKQETNIKWSKEDKQNMKYTISKLGYDPFEDVGLDEFDRKYCFNLLSGYFDTPGILEDGHKKQCVIEITMSYCQCRKITDELNTELSRSDSNEKRIASLTSAKTSLLSSIANIAKDNNISSNYSKQSNQGQDSISSMMKEMEKNDFQEIKLNLFDIKTSEAFRQIDEISNTNIANQLTLDNSDYSEIVKEQRNLIKKYEQSINKLEEENRLLKNKIIDFELKTR
jgi:hypothetical protein